MSSQWPTVDVTKAADGLAANYVFADAEGVVEGSVVHDAGLLTLTCSTQMGCKVACTFCSAGLKFVRSLSPEEVLAQVERMLADWHDVARASALLVTFMGMGEPMLNRGLVPALLQLGARYPTATLYVSTSGPRVPYESLLRLGASMPQVELQCSVHESTDARRDLLIPFHNKLDLKGIADLGRQWRDRTGRHAVMNYCVNPDNAGPEDADRLAKLFHPDAWLAKVSVINSLAEGEHSHQVGHHLAAQFMLLLQRRGFGGLLFDQVQQRAVQGACGQFAHFRDWVLKRRPGHLLT